MNEHQVILNSDLIIKYSVVIIGFFLSLAILDLKNKIKAFKNLERFDEIVEKLDEIATKFNNAVKKLDMIELEFKLKIEHLENRCDRLEKEIENLKVAK